MGIVGSGGNAGAAIFTVFFVHFSYSTAFLMMGAAAIGSAFLSLFMKTSQFSHTYEDVEQKVEKREQQENDGANENGADDMACPLPSFQPPDLEKDLKEDEDRDQWKEVIIDDV